MFRIDHIRIRELNLPLVRPFQISAGTCNVRRSLIVELSSEGVVGYGEAAPFAEPFYSAETVDTVRTLYEHLYLPRLVGREFADVNAFHAELCRGVRGNPFARAGLETAAWDLLARRDKVPIVRMISHALEALGLPKEHCTPRRYIESGLAVGIPPSEKVADLQSEIVAGLEHGYRRVKIKIRPGWDDQACAAARRVVGDAFPFWTDANAAYRFDRDLEAIRRLDRHRALFHEQPLAPDDLLDHAALAREVKTPLCLDESLTSADKARKAWQCGAARIWNIKVQRLGGLTEALRVYKTAVDCGAKLWGGTMPESGIGSQTILALAAFPQFVYPADVEASARWYEPGTDPVEICVTDDGRIKVPEEHGVQLDAERYGRATER